MRDAGDIREATKATNYQPVNSEGQEIGSEESLSFSIVFRSLIRGYIMINR